MTATVLYPDRYTDEMTREADDPVSLGLLRQMVAQNHDQSEDAHKRLREDVRDLYNRLEKVEDHLGKFGERLTIVSERRTDLASAIVPVRYVVGLLGACLAIALGMWRIDAHVGDVQNQMQAVEKLDDERNTAVKSAIEDLKKEQQLQALQLTELGNRFPKGSQK